MTIEHLNSIACGLGFFGGFVLRLADDLGPRNAAPSSLTIARSRCTCPQTVAPASPLRATPCKYHS